MKRKRPLLALFLALAASGALIWGQSGDPRPSPPQKPVTVFLVRHAETAESTRTSRDPELSELGLERAQSLSRLLGHAGVTHLYSSEFRRTAATLGPLAEDLGLEVQSIAAADRAATLEALAGLPPGSVAVVAGHSNTVPALVEALGGQLADLAEDPRHGKLLDHDSYDRLAQVILPAEAGTAVQTIELRYGP